MATKFGLDQTSSPAPLWWRRFERAYIIVLIPGLVVLVQSLGDYRNWEPELKELVTQVLLFSTAAVKAFGMFMGTGEQFPDAPQKEE